MAGIGENLKKLRALQGNMSMEKLADTAGVNKGTIWRIEKGQDDRVRGETIKRLAKALRVRADVLTGEAPLLKINPPPKEKVSLSIRCRNALALVASRYGMDENYILELAPLLFYLTAERSLLWRCKNLAEWQNTRKALKACGEKKMPYLHPRYFDDEYFAQNYVEGPEAEEQSINKRDLFALSDCFYNPEGNFEPHYNEKKNPLFLSLCEEARALREEAESLQVKKEALPDAQISSIYPHNMGPVRAEALLYGKDLGNILCPAAEYEICERERRALAKDLGDVEHAIYTGLISLDKMPKSLKRKEADAKEVAAWAISQLEALEKDGGGDADDHRTLSTLAGEIKEEIKKALEEAKAQAKGEGQWANCAAPTTRTSGFANENCARAIWIICPGSAKKGRAIKDCSRAGESTKLPARKAA